MIHNFYRSLLDNILIFLLIISFFYVVVGLAFVPSSNHQLGLKCSNIVQAIFILFVVSWRKELCITTIPIH